MEANEINMSQFPLVDLLALVLKPLELFVISMCVVNSDYHQITGFIKPSEAQ